MSKLSGDVTLGIDVGTSGCKAVLLDRKGQTICSASTEYSPSYPRQGWAEQDPDEWVHAAIQAMAEVRGNRDTKRVHVAAIGVTGQMISAVFVDESYNPVRPAILWLDQRSAPQVRKLVEQHGDTISKITKTPINTAYTLPRLLWLREHEQHQWKKTARVMLAKDYVRLRLTGELATDFSDASGTLLLDSKERCWSTEILDVMDIPERMLPRLASSHEVVGYLTKEAAHNLGLEAGLPVVAGAGDLFSENLSAGNIEGNQRLIRFGSCGSISQPLSSPVQDPDLKCPCYVHGIPDRWLLETSTQAFGLSEAWYKRVLLGGFRANESGSSVHQLVEKMVGSVAPGANGVVFHPFIQGAPYWDVSLRGSFLGLMPSHTEADLARAVLEGATYSLKDALGLLEAASGERSDIVGLQWRAVGGGSHSQAWAQIVTDVLGVELEILREASPAVGAAMLAAIGYGLFEGFDEASRQSAVVSRRTEIDPESRQAYLELYRQHCFLHEQLGRLYRELKTAKETDN